MTRPPLGTSFFNPHRVNNFSLSPYLQDFRGKASLFDSIEFKIYYSLIKDSGCIFELSTKIASIGFMILTKIDLLLVHVYWFTVVGYYKQLFILRRSARLFVLLGLIGGVMSHLDFQYISIVAWSYICVYRPVFPV